MGKGNSHIVISDKVVGYADFETVTKEWYEANGYQFYKTDDYYISKDGVTERFHAHIRIACVRIVDYKDGHEYRFCFTDMNSFLTCLRDYRVDLCYFHNLRFDGSYIVSHLQNVDDSLLDKSGLTTSITEQHVWMNIVLRYKLPDHKTHKCVFWDSAKIYNMKLEKLGKAVGIAKGGLACDTSTEITQEYIDYCQNDCDIVRAGMDVYDECIKTFADNHHIPNTVGHRWMTAASTTMNLFNRLAEQVISATRGLTDEKGRKKAHEIFMSMFPSVVEKKVTERDGKLVESMDIREDILLPYFRDMYRGATPLLDIARKNKIIDSIMTFDVNSMYPSILAGLIPHLATPIPYGAPKEVDPRDFSSYKGCKAEEYFRKLIAIRDDDDAKGRYSVVRCRIEFHLKSGHRATYLPCGGFGRKDKASCVDHYDTWGEGGKGGFVNLDVNDLELILRDYDIWDAEIVRVQRFRTFSDRDCPYGNLPKQYIEYWKDVKETAVRDGNKGIKEFAKLMMNAFYGKFGQDPENFSSDIVMDDGVIRFKTREEAELSEGYYLPIACAVTSAARNYLSKMCNAIGWEYVVYTDTDSVHITGITEEEALAKFASEDILIDDAVFGAFKYESKCDRAVYCRPKGYIHEGAVEMKDNHPSNPIGMEVKMAGANGFENFTIDDVLGKVVMATQNRQVQVWGGAIIEPHEVTVDFTPDADGRDPALKEVVRVPGMTMEASMEYEKHKFDEILPQSYKVKECMTTTDITPSEPSSDTTASTTSSSQKEESANHMEPSSSCSTSQGASCVSTVNSPISNTQSPTGLIPSSNKDSPSPNSSNGSATPRRDSSSTTTGSPKRTSDVSPRSTTSNRRSSPTTSTGYGSTSSSPSRTRSSREFHRRATLSALWSRQLSTIRYTAVKRKDSALSES